MNLNQKESLRLKKLKVDQIIAADYNPRKKLNPNDKEYQEIKRSIEEFGYVQPLIVNSDYTIIGGHQRLTVLKDLGFKEIDVIIVDVDKNQEKALNIALNKISGRWDSKLLSGLLQELNSNKFDLTLTGFEPKVLDIGIRGDAKDTQDNLVEGILNLNKAQYNGVGKYDIPEILPVYELPEIKEWIGFNYVLSDNDPEGKAVHFFIDDYQFERLWNNPAKYVDKLKQYVCVASPDFSPYGDMPLILQIYNHYRKHWIARYLQDQGVTVIPTIRCSTDKRSLDWFLDGEPKNSIVVYSTMWASLDDGVGVTMEKEFKKMVKTLDPKKIYVYGQLYDLITKSNIPTERIPTFAEKRFKNVVQETT